MITRKREQELMDDPTLDRSEHRKALEGLARLNSISGSAYAIWRVIRQLYNERHASACNSTISSDANNTAEANNNLTTGAFARTARVKPIRILDLACGSADVSLDLWRIASAAGIKVAVHGCDISPVAVEMAQRRAVQIGANSHFFQLNAVTDPLPHGYDVVMNSLFMHHLDEEQAIDLMRKMSLAAEELVVINDLVRSEVSLAVVTAACHVLSRSPVVHFDGPASVRAAYTPKELLAMARQAGMSDATVRERFPCRMVLSSRKPKSE